MIDDLVPPLRSSELSGSGSIDPVAASTIASP